MNIYNIIKQGGAGVYTIHMAVLADDLADGGEYGHLLIRGNQAIERIDYSEYYKNMNEIKNIAGNEELVLNY